MRRRLLVGKAMVHQPPILVLDEPTAGVDVSLRQKLWEMIRSLNDQGVTIVLTTHYLEEAEALCDEIAIINHGQLIKQALKKDLLAEAGRKRSFSPWRIPLKLYLKTSAKCSKTLM